MTQKYLARRRELSDQICSLIDREGYEALRVRYICEQLGISTGTFYHYFPSQTDLILLLYRRIDDYFQRELQPSFTGNEVDNLRLFAESYGRYCAETGVAATHCFCSLPLSYQGSDHLSEARPISQVLVGIFERGLEKGQFCTSLSPRQCARYTMVVLRGFCFDWAKREGNYDLLEFIRTFFPFSIRGMVEGWEGSGPSAE